MKHLQTKKHLKNTVQMSKNKENDEVNEEELRSYYWNFGDGKQLHQFQISSVANPVAISPDGKRLFCSDATSGIKVVDIEHFGELQTLKGHSKRPLAIAVTADGRELVTVSSELAIRRWDARPLVPAKSAQ